MKDRVTKKNIQKELHLISEVNRREKAYRFYFLRGIYYGLLKSHIKKAED